MINKLKKINDENLKKMILIGVYFLMIFLGWIAPKMPNNIGQFLPISFILGLSFGIILYYYLFAQKVNGQIIPVLLLVAIFWDVTVASDYSVKTNTVIIVEGLLLYNIGLIALIYKYLKEKDIKINMALFKEFIQKNKEKILISVLFVLFNLDIFSTWLYGDGYRYYSWIEACKKWDFSNFTILRFAGHLSQGYTVFALIGESFSTRYLDGIRLANFVIVLITILSFYEIMKRITNNSSKCRLVIYTLLFAFSPILCGMIAEVNLDIGVLCFLVWLMAAYLCDYSILSAFSGLLLCFSKETGILLYGTFMIGIFIEMLVKNKVWRNTLKSNLNLILDKRLLINCFGGITWIAYKFYSHIDNIAWRTEFVSGKDRHDLVKINAFGFDFKYIIFKIKQIAVMNAYWLFCLLIIVLVVVYLVKKPKCENKKIFDNLFFNTTFIGSLVGCFAFVTWTNYRYVICSVFYLILFTIMLIDKVVKNKNLQWILLGVLLFSTVISNYHTDFLTRKCFIEVNASESNKMVITPAFGQDNGYVKYVSEAELEKAAWADTMIYNKQYANFSVAFEKFMADIEYDGNKLIIIPYNLYSEGAVYERLFGAIDENKKYLVWNQSSKRVEYSCFYREEENVNDVKMKLLVTNDDISSYLEAKNSIYTDIYYLDIPLVNKKSAEPSIDKSWIIKQKEYSRFGTTFEVYKLK